jgi:hypothetical protein
MPFYGFIASMGASLLISGLLQPATAQFDAERAGFSLFCRICRYSETPNGICGAIWF